ncbi:WD domain G-beta repeat [Phytophthora infestans]|uniref:WD domain G-beta repeat n=1 Tax=Phytophthora infestans TaxID=4787 RepID=A0A833WKA8_PHYIN|nr:WD domain G-beta repeat [Phytophthora infestans]
MQLRRLYLRYYPPALRLEYVHSNGQINLKTIDLPHLNAESNIALLAQQLVDKERLLTRATLSKIKELLHRLLDKHLVHAGHQQGSAFRQHSTLRPHQLPMTNMACSKSAKLVATSSYDKTIRLLRPFDPPCPPTMSSLHNKHCEKEVATLVGHDGVVFNLAFNKPHATRLLSGSFDKTCRLWDVQTKTSIGVYRAHAGEVVGVVFAPGSSNSECFGSHSVDGTAVVWDVPTESPQLMLSGHSAEVSCLAFDSDDKKLIATGSCDSTVRLWDTRYGSCFRCIEHHDADILSVSFDYQANTLLSSSSDGTCKLWDARTGKCLYDWDDHQGHEVTHATFNATGALVVSCGTDGNAFIYDTLTGTRRCVLSGHQNAVNKICFSMQGLQVLTASTDGTARVWNAFSGECLQVLRGHDAEVFDCSFSYDGKIALTASIDNSVRVWERQTD